jgi:hypothetical protein
MSFGKADFTRVNLTIRTPAWPGKSGLSKASLNRVTDPEQRDSKPGPTALFL